MSIWNGYFALVKKISHSHTQPPVEYSPKDDFACSLKTNNVYAQIYRHEYEDENQNGADGIWIESIICFIKFINLKIVNICSLHNIINTYYILIFIKSLFSATEFWVRKLMPTPYNITIQLDRKKIKEKRKQW